MANSRLERTSALLIKLMGCRSLQYDEGHYPCILTQLAFAHRSPSKFITQTIIALPVLSLMRSLLDPSYQAGKGGKPKYGVDDIDASMDVDIGKAAYPLKKRESGLVDESRYAAPALQRYQHSRHHKIILLTAAYQSEVVPYPPIEFACLGEDSNDHGPGNKDGQGLNSMNDILDTLVVLRKASHEKYGAVKAMN